MPDLFLISLINSCHLVYQLLMAFHVGISLMRWAFHRIPVYSVARLMGCTDRWSNRCLRRCQIVLNRRYVPCQSLMRFVRGPTGVLRRCQID